MTPNAPGQEPLEDRLRDALDARAHTVGPESLRRAAPPSEQPGRRFPRRATALTLLALAAALAGVLLAVGWVAREGGGTPVEPAHPHERSTRPSSPAPEPPSPAPSDVTPPLPVPD